MGRTYWASKPGQSDYVIHSTGPWKDHKYIKIDNGKYIYPGDQTSGTQQKKATTPQQAQKPAAAKPAAPATSKPATPTPAKPATTAPANNAAKKPEQKVTTSTATQKTDAQKKQSTEDKNSDEHVKKMASTVIRGKYGNGEERKKRLRSEGESWERIQNKVNEMLGSKVRHKVDGEDSDSDSSSSSSSSSKKKKSSSKSSKSSSSSSKRKKSSSGSSKRKSSGTRKRKSSGRKKKTKTAVKTVSEMTPEELAAAGVKKDKKNSSSVEHSGIRTMGRYYIKRDYVAHSSGPWQNHKYVRKIGDGPDAVYIYADGKARNAAGKVVGNAKQFGNNAVNGSKKAFHSALKAARNGVNYAKNYANGVKKASRNYDKAKERSEFYKAGTRMLSKQTSDNIRKSYQTERKAANVYSNTHDSYYKKIRDSQSAYRQKQNDDYNKFNDRALKAYKNEKRSKKKYRDAITKPGRDLAKSVSRGGKRISKILNRGSKKKSSKKVDYSNRHFNFDTKSSEKYLHFKGKPKTVKQAYNIKRGKDGSVTLTRKRKR